jgi:cytoskeletal protein RodZ
MAHNVLEIKNASFKAAVGAAALVEFADAVDSIQLQATATPKTWAPISGANQQTVSQQTETVVLNIGQDLTAGSLWLFLRDNHGKTGKCEFYPKGGTTPKVAANVTFQAPGVLGGSQGGDTASGATLLVSGIATITPG